MRLWNIGAEGQLLLGAWAASTVVLVPLLPVGTPAVIVLPVMLVAGFLGGAFWGLIPGFLRSRFGVNEIIATLMLNSIAFAWIQYWVFGPWTEGGFQMSAQFPPEAWLPRLSDLAEAAPVFRGLTVHAGFLVAVAAAVVVWFIVERSAWGYEIRLIGDNPRAARYAGVRIARNILLVFAVSGGLAGIAGMTEVAGVVHRLQDNFSPGYGYTAIIVAYLAKFHPLRVVPVAILFGALHPGRARDPALGRPRDDPGDHPVLPDRERGLPALPRRHRAPPARRPCLQHPHGHPRLPGRSQRSQRPRRGGLARGPAADHGGRHRGGHDPAVRRPG